jgi:hypothetical protein
MQPRPKRVPHDVYTGHTGRRADGAAATVTRPGGGGPCGVRPARTATTVAAARARSRGGEATPGLERRPRAHPLGGQQTFFECLTRDRPGAHDGQQGQRPHREGDMPIPAGPAPHVILIQAHVALGLLNTTLDGPAAPSYPYDLLQGRRVRGQDDRGGQLRGGADTAPDQPPAALAGRQQRRQGQPAVVVPARPLSAVPCTEARSPRQRQGGQDGFHLALRRAEPDICLARHGEDRGLKPVLQPTPQASVVPIHAVAGDPFGGHPGREGASQPLAGQLRLGGKRPVRRDAGLPAALHIVGPSFGQIQLPSQQRLAQWAGITQQHADLAVLHFAGRTAILAGHARRVRPFFETAGLVEHQHAVELPQMLDHIATELIPHGIGVPVGPAQHILEAIGDSRAADFCHLPTVVALGLTEQALQIRLHPVTGLRARNIGAQPPGYIRQVGLAARHDTSRHIRRGQHGERSRFIDPLHGSAIAWFRPPFLGPEPRYHPKDFVTTVVLEGV